MNQFCFCGFKIFPNFYVVVPHEQANHGHYGGAENHHAACLCKFASVSRMFHYVRVLNWVNVLQVGVHIVLVIDNRQNQPKCSKNSGEKVGIPLLVEYFIVKFLGIKLFYLYFPAHLLLFFSCFSEPYYSWTFCFIE